MLYFVNKSENHFNFRVLLAIAGKRRIIGKKKPEENMAGFNTKIEHNGFSYIVQTQDLGSPTYCIESLIYKSGRALSPRKTFYSHLLNSPTFKEEILQLLQEKHNAVLKAITAGQFDLT